MSIPSPLVDPGMRFTNAIAVKKRERNLHYFGYYL